jgi:membrane-associated phospholipid phosphatase
MYLFFQSASQLIIGAALVTCMSYLSARLALPLRDQQLIAADQFVHFNWLAWLNWLNDWPTLARVLTLAYESTDLQFFVLLMALLFCKRTDRLQKLILTFFLSGIMVVTLGAMFPAVAGYIYYNIDLSQIPHLHPAAPRDQEIMLMGMREHTINILPLKFDGIVQFPSFHSVLAILFMYASMPVRWLRTIIVPLNLLMVISTPVDGGHYLMDIVAGIGIAFIAIYAANRLFKHIPAQVPASAQPELIAA